MVLANGNVKKSTFDVHKRAERQWANALQINNAQGLVDHCNKAKPASIMITRNSAEFNDQISAAKEQASYLAKTKGKEISSKFSRKVSGTRLPKVKNEKSD